MTSYRRHTFLIEDAPDPRSRGATLLYGLPNARHGTRARTDASVRAVVRPAAVFLGFLFTLTGCPDAPTPEPVAQPDANADTGASATAENKPPTRKGVPNPHGKKIKQIPAPPDVAAPPPEAKKTDSGLAYVVLESGDGDTHPGPTDSVTVTYTGWNTTGETVITNDGEEPRSFQVNKVTVGGWTEGIQLLKKGDKARFWVPEAVVNKGRPGPAQGMLVYDIKLLDFRPPPPVPEDVAAPPSTAKKTKSGIPYRVVAKGKDKGKDHPKLSDRVTFHYSGWTTDGAMFDSSVPRMKPTASLLERAPAGWQEVVPLMSRGDTYRFWVPAEVVAAAKRSGLPEGMLVFEVELIDFKEIPKPPKPPPAPEDVAKPPANATVTASGLAYRTLAKGTGTEHPTKASRVKAHYTGWTTDGKMFNSSITRGRPLEFGLKGVIPGWTEGVQLMTVGEKARFWIPESLAYRGKPAGMVVFDIELVGIVR